MKNYGILLFILSFNLIIVTSYSQESDKKSILIKKVETELKEFDSTARNFDYSKRLASRKIVVKGWVGKTNKSFEQQIKYYRNGLKKEDIKIYTNASGVKTILMHVVKINDKFHYVEYYETIKEKENGLEKKYKEVMIDNRLYQKNLSIE